MQFPKQLCTHLSKVMAFWIRSAASLGTACVLSLQETLHLSCFFFQPIRLKISSHLSIWASSKIFSVITGLVKWIIIPYHVSLAQIVTLIHVCMNLIPHEFSLTCSKAPQGSFSSSCTTIHLSPWKQEDKHRTSPANYYSIWNRPRWLSQKLHLTCRASVVFAATTQITKLNQNAAGGISGRKFRFLFSAVSAEKEKLEEMCTSNP